MLKNISALFIIMLSTLNCYATSNFYVSSKIGINKFAKNKDYEKIFNGSKLPLKHSPKSGFAIEIGGGYYLNENIRMELNFLYPNESKTIISQNGPFQDIDIDSDGENETVASAKMRIKPMIKAVMVKGFIDYDFHENSKIYVGAGIGYSLVKSKANVSASITDPGAGDQDGGDGDGGDGGDGDQQGPTLVSGLDKARSKGNLAYSATVGASYKLNNNFDIFADYTYTYYGRAKPTNSALIDNNHKVQGKKWRGHLVAVGLRYRF